MLLHYIVSVTMQLSSTITSKGQVLIPAEIRNRLNIKPFDRVTFDVSGIDMVVKKAATTDEMYGYVKFKKKLTDRQLEKAINKATEDGMSKEI